MQHFISFSPSNESSFRLYHNMFFQRVGASFPLNHGSRKELQAAQLKKKSSCLPSSPAFENKFHLQTSCVNMALLSCALHQRAIPCQEINSALIPGTRRHFHYHSSHMSGGLVQFAIISKRDKCVNSL